MTFTGNAICVSGIDVATIHSPSNLYMLTTNYNMYFVWVFFLLCLPLSVLTETSPSP